MRIATWNCARGPWPKKREVIDTIGADLAVITEAPKAAASDGLHWTGNGLARNGTTVIPSSAFHVEPLPTRQGAICVNPFRVSGLHEFTLLTVWTWPAAPYKNYKEPLLAGLKAYHDLPGPFVIAGDFNGNACFDRPGTRLKWSACLAAVEALGVVSAYHVHTGEQYGRETQPTQYQIRRESMRFHLDYVFVPREWQPAIRSVRVPTFAEFSVSDHRPVIVDLDLPLRAV